MRFIRKLNLALLLGHPIHTYTYTNTHKTTHTHTHTHTHIQGVPIRGQDLIF